jgi:hypothetical protein
LRTTLFYANLHGDPIDHGDVRDDANLLTSAL